MRPIKTSSADYVIVGGGSAGCVLANRLSEDEKCRVIVLEAGRHDKHPLIQIPFGVGRVWNAPEFNWSYISEREPALDYRRLEHPRGKLLGGCSSINMSAYVRGAAADFDGWAATGLTDWAYHKVLPYFKMAETYLSGSSEFRGDNGPMAVAQTPVQDSVLEAFFEAGQAIGIPTVEDYNGPRQEGLARGQFNVAAGRRVSCATAYLHPVAKRSNLQVVTQAHAKRIEIKEGRAKCVVAHVAGQDVIFEASREVILAAGAYNSPQLLMLSGIGPADQLKDLSIQPIADRPEVGENLQDHASISLEWMRNTPSQFNHNLRYDRLAFNFLRAWFFRSGPAAAPVGFGTGFVKLDPTAAAPELQIFLRLFSAMSEPWWPIVGHPPLPLVGMTACLLHPYSRGQVRLRSTEPSEAPVISNQILSDERDREKLRDAVKCLRLIAAQEPMADHIGRELSPEPKAQSDLSIDEMLRRHVNTVYHPVGTCRMGTDAGAVVDERLRVRQIEGLRVVDASIMPNLISGNINAVVVMIAEKAAEYIRQDYVG